MVSSSSSSSPEIAYAAPPPPGHSPFKYASQDDVLEDLSSRFILNLPDEELASVERICFQVEQAHWYYEDFIREENPKFPSLPLKKFSAMLFHACPMLQQWSHDHEQAFDTFMQYKTRVPVCGAIMLNDTWDKCVLVKGWKSSSGWGFPKGKINQDEEPHRCAIREVLEETGYDLTSQIRTEDFIEMTIKEQRITLYIVGGISEDYAFQTRTRKEISRIEWFSLADLPTWRRNKQVPGKFYLISPFVPPLKEFIKANKPGRRRVAHRKVSSDNDTRAMHVVNGGNAESRTVVPGLDGPIRCGTQGPSSQSSSSADNGGPATPSPQYAEAHAVAAGAILDDNLPEEKHIDHHFARLLNGLTLSAKKLPPVGNKDSNIEATTPKQIDANSTPITSEQRGRMISNCAVSQSVPAPVGIVPSLEKRELQSLSTSQSPLITRVSAPSSGIHAQVLDEVSVHPHSTDRRVKHLALLETIATESARMPSPSSSISHVVESQRPLFNRNAHPSALPRPSSSVPPLPQVMNTHNPPMVLRQPNPNFANGIGHGQRLPSQASTQHSPLPPLHILGHDPILAQMQMRPGTSLAAFPSANGMQSPPRRHHSRLSAHQGSLLNILGTANGVIPQPLQSPAALPLPQLLPVGVGHGAIHSSTLTQVQQHAIQPPRMSVPPHDPPRVNSIALTAPLSYTSPRHIPGFTVNPVGVNVNAANVLRAPPNQENLLSILNSSGIPKSRALP